MREESAWIIVSRGGHMLVSTVRRLRVEAIKTMVGPEDGWRNRWRRWQREGCTCQRVRLVAAPEGE